MILALSVVDFSNPPGGEIRRSGSALHRGEIESGRGGVEKQLAKRAGAGTPSVFLLGDGGGEEGEFFVASAEDRKWPELSCRSWEASCPGAQRAHWRTAVPGEAEVDAAQNRAQNKKVKPLRERQTARQWPSQNSRQVMTEMANSIIQIVGEMR